MSFVPNPQALQQLRDVLVTRGTTLPPPRRQFGSLPPSADDALRDAILRRVGPICELLYLVMVADGQCTADERRVLRGAARVLSDDALSVSTIDSMVDELSRELNDSNIDERLDAISAWLSVDRAVAESAYTLAAVMAVADFHTTTDETALLGKLAERLGISSARAQELSAVIEH